MPEQHTGAPDPQKCLSSDGLNALRTHLANERTFLAWVRTGLAVAAFGFVLEKLDLFLISGHDPAAAKLMARLSLLGHAALLAAVLILLLAAWRFATTWKDIGQHDARFTPLPDILIFLAAIVLLAMALLATRTLM